MNSEIWGPHYWFVIHTIAINYPIKPNALEKKRHYKFIQDLPTFLPDKKSSKNTPSGAIFLEAHDAFPAEPE